MYNKIFSNFFFSFLKDEKCSVVSTLQVEDTSDLLPVTDFKMKTSFRGSSKNSPNAFGDEGDNILFSLNIGPVCFQ